MTANRGLVRAIAYATAEHARFGTTLGAHGFEIEAAEDEASIPVAIAVDAMALASRVDAIVLAADPRQLGPLLRSLRAQGIRSELAGFTSGRATAATGHLLLGKDALFIP